MDLDTDISVESLDIFICARYPDREPGDRDSVEDLARQLHAAGIRSLAEVATMLDRNVAALITHERTDPPNGMAGSKFNAVGAVRISLLQDTEMIPGSTQNGTPAGTELTPQFLAVFLRDRYRDREPGESNAVAELGRILTSTGFHTIGDVAAMLNRTAAALDAQERTSPPNGEVGAKFSAVEAVRISLTADTDALRERSEPVHESLVRGKTLEDAGELAAAEAAYREADSDGVDASIEICRVCIERRDGQAMAAAFEVAIARGHVTAIFNTGVVLSRQGEDDAAEIAYRAAYAVGDLYAACNLGVLLERRGDLGGAAEAYGRADRAGDGDAACCLGMMLEDMRDLDGAQAAFERASERSHTTGALRLGTLLEDRGDRAGAEAAYQRAEDLGSNSGPFNLGVLHHREGELAEAEIALRRAETAGNPSAPYALGLVLYQRGDRSSAETAFERALQAGDTEAAAALEELRRTGR